MEVTRLTDFEKSEGFWKVEDEHFVEDQMMDEQALLVNVKDRGLVIITGCAHPGIINTLNHAKNTSKLDDVYAIIGGFHLAGANDERIRATTDELLRVSMKGPKQIRTYCPKCKSHTDHQVSIYKKGKDRAMAIGNRRHERDEHGYGGQKFPKLKRTAKTTKKQLSRLSCKTCDATVYRLGIRLRKLGLI